MRKLLWVIWIVMIISIIASFFPHIIGYYNANYNRKMIDEKVIDLRNDPDLGSNEKGEISVRVIRTYNYPYYKADWHFERDDQYNTLSCYINEYGDTIELLYIGDSIVNGKPVIVNRK